MMSTAPSAPAGGSALFVEGDFETIGAEVGRPSSNFDRVRVQIAAMVRTAGGARTAQERFSC